MKFRGILSNKTDWSCTNIIIYRALKVIYHTLQNFNFGNGSTWEVHTTTMATMDFKHAHYTKFTCREAWGVMSYVLQTDQYTLYVEYAAFRPQIVQIAFSRMARTSIKWLTQIGNHRPNESHKKPLYTRQYLICAFENASAARNKS